ncbi:MAG: hypothetical protein EAX96_14750 [Candidatus Lokiarchaeota archaeon]|nr:hypothetical protein [Candidatus Lokiarchaeota archaeon]
MINKKEIEIKLIEAPLIYEGTLPLRKWKKNFGPKIWLKHKFKHNLACCSCMLACRTDYQIFEGEYKGLKTFTGHHFLPARAALRLGLEKPEQAIKLLDVCNRVGLGYFTTTGILNLLSRYTDYLKRDFSEYLKIMEHILNKTGIGDVLAEGWNVISEKLGINLTEFSEGTGIFKGVDCIQDGRTTSIDPQRFSYITNPRPHHGGTQSIYTLPKMSLQILKDDASHLGINSEEFERIFTETPYYGKFNVARFTKHAEDAMAVHNSLGTCIVSTLFGTDIINIEKLVPLYTALTGIQMTPEKLKRIGERSFTLYKLLNIREGFKTRDICSENWLTPKETPEGKKVLMDYYRERELSRSDIEKLIDDYYNERKWNPENGIPSKAKLKELKLEDFLLM